MSEACSKEVDVARGDEHSEQPTVQDRRVAIHTDTYDIDEAALGTNLPKRYYLSSSFIGTVTVCCLDNGQDIC